MNQNAVKRGLALVSAFSMAFALAFAALVVFAPAEAQASARVFYDLADDEMIQGQEPGQAMEDHYSPYWADVGDIAFEVIETPRGHNGFRSTRRAADWTNASFDVAAAGLDFVNSDYAVYLKGNADSGLELFAIQGSEPWPHIGTASEFASNGDFEIFIPSWQEAIRSKDNFVARSPVAGQFSPLLFQNSFWVTPVQSMAQYSIYEFIVAETGWTPSMLGGGGAAATQPAAPEPVAEPEPEPEPESPATATAPEPIEPITAPITPAAPAGSTELRFVVGQTTYTRNGQSFPLDAAPYNKDGRVMVPLRQVGEALSAELNWDGATSTATLTAGGRSVSVTIGVEIPGGMGTPEIVNERTFVPLGYIATAVGGTPQWDGANNTAIITLN